MAITLNLAVIALTAAAAGQHRPPPLPQVQAAQRAHASRVLEVLQEAAMRFRLDVGRWPTTKEGFASLFKRPSSAPGWHGPYIASMPPLDPWKHAYHYTASGDSIRIWSFGSDGKPGGKGPAQDLLVTH